MKTLKAYVYLKTTRLLPKTLIGSFERRQEKQLMHVRKAKSIRIHEALHAAIYLFGEKLPIYNLVMG